MSGLNLLVFREARRSVRSRDLKSALASEISQENLSKQDSLITALLRAGELECAIADSGVSTDAYQEVSDRLAEKLVSGENRFDHARLREMIERAPAPELVSVSPAEGFAYYALHPLSYARVLDSLPSAAALAVIGIRSIGTTLSAVTAAEARRRGVKAERITVRPQGHPYNRETRFPAEQLAFLRSALAQDALFLVVDEGPGLSGSSFLSVAEALEQAGVAAERIILICAHAPQMDFLCAENASARARRFRWQAVDSASYKPEEAQAWIGAGEWRRHLIADPSEWPAAWTCFERAKYLSPPLSSRQRLFKFAGLGHYGEPVIEREQRIAEAGLGVSPRAESDGFASYPWMHGRPMTTRDVSADVLSRVAEYCAFRARAFQCEISDLNALKEMAEHNSQELGFPMSAKLELQRPVIVDGRMQPHEWLPTGDGSMIKTDCGSHGDDHFFPGPTDIAWDLAGAIVEWRMDREQHEFFLESYRRASGDDASGRTEGFIAAYTVFRCAWGLMAANAMRGTEEQLRLERAAADYGAQLLRLVKPNLATPAQNTVQLGKRMAIRSA